MIIAFYYIQFKPEATPTQGNHERGWNKRLHKVTSYKTLELKCRYEKREVSYLHKESILLKQILKKQ